MQITKILQLKEIFEKIISKKLFEVTNFFCDSEIQNFHAQKSVDISCPQIFQSHPKITSRLKFLWFFRATKEVELTQSSCQEFQRFLGSFFLK